MKEEVYRHMLETRGEKFRWFLRALRAFKHLAGRERGEILESTYCAMRYIDDVVDGDRPLPQGYSSSHEYVLGKLALLEGGDAKDGVDALILDSIGIAESLGLQVRPEMEDIITSMLFDANRKGTYEAFSREELEYHFHMLDIRGTISGAIKLFGDDASKYPLLEPLGIASRIYYNLRDYDQDISAGYVNIPQEEMDEFGITHLIGHPGIRQWFRSEAMRGLALIQMHRKNMDNADFGYLARAALHLVFERPAQQYFDAVLDGSL